MTALLHSAVVSALCARYGIPEPEPEYRFARPRKFAADFAWICERVLLEVEGGIYSRQAHGSISGILRDIEKYNLAAVRGYRVIRCTPQTLITGVETVAECLKQGAK